MVRYSIAMASRARRTIARKSAPPAPDEPAIDFQAILESAPDVVYVLDLDGRFTYLNARAYEVFGYDRAEGSRFLGRSTTEILIPGANAPAVGAIRHRVEFPHDRQVFRVAGRHKDGSTIPLEVHGGPVWRGGRIIGRMGVCRVLEPAMHRDGAAHRSGANALQQERMRVARGLRDAIAQIVFGVTPERDASESFLVDVQRATRADLAAHASRLGVA